MTRRERGMPWQPWLVAAAALLSLAGCGGTSANAGPGQPSPTAPPPSPTATSPVPNGPPVSPTATSTGSVVYSRRACALIPDSDAAAALGMAVTKGLPVPAVNLHNGALGGTCEWTDSAGGTVLVIILKYPSTTTAAKVFVNSKSSAVANTQPLHLPNLAPLEFADTGTFGTTKIAQSFLLDGNRELNVTINEQLSGSGSQFSLRAFLTLVQQVARAWR